MTVHVNEHGVIELAGRCEVEDAEVLQRHLLAAAGSIVKWTDCEYLHAAVVQVLLAAEARVRGAPKSAFLRAHIAPVIGATAK